MSVFHKITNFLYNFYSFFAGFIYKRSKDNVVIGGWGGRSFSDNSRFLFQYLCKNKERFGLKNIIWATRNKTVYSMLISQGQQACLIGTKESKRWHLKSRTHIICNMYSNTMSFQADIDTRYSCGARKIQLWHGVGVKACGFLANSNKNKKLRLKKIYKKYISPLFSEGFWEKCFFVATSEENKRIAVLDCGFKPSKVIIGLYPRLCCEPTLSLEEQRIINDLKEKKKTGKIIMYLPTFRKESSGFVPPESISGFSDWLTRNNFYWVAKTHSASSVMENNIELANVIFLQPEFDINTLYNVVDMVISDYSSASSDAIYKDIITLEYCPDYEYYKNDDRGFVRDFDDYHVFEPVIDPSNLFSEVERRMSLKPEKIKKHSEVKNLLFGKSNMAMEEFVKIILDIK